MTACFRFGLKLISTILLLLLSADTKGANYPVVLRSRHNIESHPSTLNDIYIGELPVIEYPLLAKFVQVKQIRFNNTLNRENVGATDEKLRALSNLSFTNLTGIAMLNCSRVTDDGIKTLTKIPSLRWLQLEGTSITDAALDVMASQMQLAEINCANCPKVNVSGLKSIAASAFLRDLSFSAVNLQQADILQLIKMFKTNVTRCQIIDTERKLDTGPLKTTAAEKRIQLFVYSKGALQLLLDGTGKRDKL